MGWTQSLVLLSKNEGKINILWYKIRLNTYQLILISSHSSKLSFWKDKGSVFLLLYISDWPIMTLSPLDQVDTRLELVHGVQDHLGRKIFNMLY